MFEIGSILRHARERQGLSLDDCERATKIRAALLRAIEEERFDRLPEPAYTRGFLRAYARFLGVDEEPVLAEYESRQADLPDAGEHELKPLPEPPRRIVPGRARPGGRRRVGRRGGALWSGLGWLALGGVGAVLVLVWTGGGGDAPAPVPAPLTTPAPALGPSPATAEPATTAAARPAAPRRVVLRVTGGGDEGSYLEVRRGGADGPELFQGIVGPGERRGWSAPARLWIRVGWTPSLTATVNGRPAALEGGTADFLVTRAGARPVGTP